MRQPRSIGRDDKRDGDQQRDGDPVDEAGGKRRQTCITPAGPDIAEETRQRNKHSDTGGCGNRLMDGASVKRHESVVHHPAAHTHQARQKADAGADQKADRIFRQV
ncbi:hypothetical protein D3C87_1737810 [compost metagenome]